VKQILQALNKTEKLELELAGVLEKVADIMQEPASRRDRYGLKYTWQKASQLRQQMKLPERFLKKVKQPVRRNMSSSDYRTQRKIYERARAHKKRLHEWDKVDHVVWQHFDPVRTPLLPTSQPGVEDALLRHLYKAFHLLANPATQHPDAKDRGCFSDIAFPVRTFDLLMTAAYRVGLAQNPRRSLRFLDVGCGGGTKVYAATRYFGTADGLEYDPGYAAAAQQTLQVLGASSSTVFLADALAFDAYSEYDVIYFYRPLRSNELLEKMEKYIIRQASVGTILVAPYNTTPMGRCGMECANIEGPIYVTGIEQADADQLRSDAEATGTIVPEKRADQAFRTNYWAPILEAASFRGRVF